MIFKLEKTLTSYVKFDVSDEDVELLKKDFMSFYTKHKDKFIINYSDENIKEELHISTNAF